MSRATRHGVFSIAASVLWLGMGCGYHFAGTGNRLPPEIHTISLGPIQNMTREVGLEKALLEGLEDEVASHGRLVAVTSGAADADLTGAVREYISRPVSFNSRDTALQYQISMSVDLELRRRDNGKLLWKTIGQREVQDFSAVPGVVVTSSSQFSQQTVNANNLQQFTDISLSESTKREANERLIESLSRDLYNQMMEDF